MPAAPSDPDVEWNRHWIVSAMLGTPFKKRAPFSEAEWDALKQIGSLAEKRSLQVLWKMPVSRLIAKEKVPANKLDSWYKSIATAVVISEPPFPMVRAIVLDTRDPFYQSIAALLAEYKSPCVSWYGPERLKDTIRDLSAILIGVVPPPERNLLNWWETAARTVVLHAIEKPLWSEFDFIPQRVTEEIQQLASIDTGAGSGEQLVAATTIWVTAEIALSAVVGEAEGSRHLYGWQPRIVAAWMKDHKFLLDRSSLDIVVFPDGLSAPPLFALEVDGRLHDIPKQQAKDRRKDYICEHAGVPLVRVKIDAIPTALAGDNRETAELIVEAKTLLPALIQTLIRYLLHDRENFEPRRAALAEKERSAFLRALEIKGLTLDQLNRDVGAMKTVLQSIRDHFANAWMEYDHDVELHGYMCSAVPAQLTAEEIANRVEWLRVFVEKDALPDMTDMSPSPLSLSFGYALNGLSGELLDAGWKLGKMRFEPSESGTRALLDITRIKGQKLVSLRSRSLRLSGVSRYIDYRGVEVAVAALSLMYAARNRARSGK